jgi:hypothetical protein
MSSSRSDGDSRVLFVLNLLLSFVFSYVVVWGLAFIVGGYVIVRGDDAVSPAKVEEHA